MSEQNEGPDTNPDSEERQPTRRTFLQSSAISTALPVSTFYRDIDLPLTTITSQTANGGSSARTSDGARPSAGPVKTGPTGENKREASSFHDSGQKTISGRFITSNGSPAADNTVVARASGSTVGSDYTDSTGAFELTAPEDADELFFVQFYDTRPLSPQLWLSEEYPIFPSDGTVDIYPIPIDDPESQNLGTIRLPAGSKLDVRVVDPSGDPVPTATVELTQKNGNASVGYRGYTDYDGLINPTEVSDDTGLELTGTVDIVVQPPDCDRFPDKTYERSVTVTGPTTVEVEIDAGSALSLSGQILQPNGMPAANNLIVVYPDGYLPIEDPNRMAGTNTDKEGRFSMTVPTCPENLQFYQLYDAMLSTSTFDIPDDTVSVPTDGTPDIYGIPTSDDLGSVTLPTGYQVSITVTDPEGRPVPDVLYEIEQITDNGFVGIDGTLDENGQISIESSDDPGLELVGEVFIKIQPPEDSNEFADVSTWRELVITEPQSVSLTLPRNIPLDLEVSTTINTVVPGGLQKVEVDITNTSQIKYSNVRIEVDTSGLPPEWSIEREVVDSNPNEATWDTDSQTWTDVELDPGDTISRGLLIRIPETASTGTERNLRIRATSPDGETVISDAVAITTSDGDMFDPTVHGFGFMNWSGGPLTGSQRFPGHNHLAPGNNEVQSVLSETVIPEWEDAGVEIPDPISSGLALLLYGLINVSSATNGHCYGMVYAAQEYYEDPDAIPREDVDTAADINSPSPNEDDRVGSDIDKYHNTQLLNSSAVTAIIALKNGAEIDYDELLSWIKSTIESEGTAPIALTDQAGNSGHQVLAYAYKEDKSAQETRVFVYDPNASAENHWAVETENTSYFRQTALTFDTSGPETTLKDTYASISGDGQFSSVYRRAAPLLDGQTINDPVESFAVFVGGSLTSILTDALEGIINFDIKISNPIDTQSESATRDETAMDGVTVEVTDPDGEPLQIADSTFTTYHRVDFDSFHYRFDAPPGDYRVDIATETNKEITVRSKGAVRDGGTIDTEYTTTIEAEESAQLIATVPNDPNKSGLIKENIDLAPIGDFENQPTDPDGDGLYEDINGDGVFDIVDVQALFANLDDPTIQSNPDAFDFNNDGQVDVVDVQRLFNKLS